MKKKDFLHAGYRQANAKAQAEMPSETVILHGCTIAKAGVKRLIQVERQYVALKFEHHDTHPTRYAAHYPKS